LQKNNENVKGKKSYNHKKKVGKIIDVMEKKKSSYRASSSLRKSSKNKNRLMQKK